MPSPTEKLHWRHTMEAMFLHTFPLENYPGLKARFAEIGFDVDQPLLPAYNETVFRAALAVQRAFVFPGMRDGEAAFQQGSRFIEIFFDRTPLGSALKLLLRALGPRRILERMARNLHTGNNFVDALFLSAGPSSGRLQVSDVFDNNPEWLRGVIKHGMKLSGSPVELEVESFTAPAATYHATWK